MVGVRADKHFAILLAIIYIYNTVSYIGTRLWSNPFIRLVVWFSYKQNIYVWCKALKDLFGVLKETCGELYFGVKCPMTLYYLT